MRDPEEIEPKTVLIVDDDDDVRDALTLDFENSRQYKFEVISAANPFECVKMEQANGTEFDICIIDLRFAECSGTAELLGFGVLTGLSAVREGGLVLVYSASPTIENVVRSMQLGASDFIAKSECPTHELVERVEKSLFEKRIRMRDDAFIKKYLNLEYDALLREYSGQVIAIAVIDSRPQVVATGKTRLEANLNYYEARRADPNRLFPIGPHLHLVPLSPSSVGEAYE